ncbi:response regulator [Planctomicrobium sp. SH668]|uniref:response regulator n=1 Tax=Planctomicrobium sp. SH668 TaxID=3448126 RepID=UPI003F5C6D27
MSQDAIGRPMEILLVEDSLVAARLTMGALAKSGIEHRLTWMNNGQEAQTFLKQSGKYSRAPVPDLVLLDLLLPEIDGRILLREMRKSSHLKQCPAIIMTGTAGDQDIAEFESLDVQGYLRKPIDLTEFLRIVEELKGYWKSGMIVKRK